MFENYLQHRVGGQSEKRKGKMKNRTFSHNNGQTKTCKLDGFAM